MKPGPLGGVSYFQLFCQGVDTVGDAAEPG
jgi:hypothetical protein